MGVIDPNCSLASLAETIPKCTITWDWDSGTWLHSCAAAKGLALPLYNFQPSGW